MEKFVKKRMILVVDDELINREILGNMLMDTYDVLYASDGVAALETLNKYQDMISLVMLDVLMPRMNGLEVLEAMQKDEHLKRIPVIVLTLEKSYEIKCLQLGASDFIKKPYEIPEVILARVQRTIELSENTTIIQTTERDELTGLYNQNYFLKYVENFDKYNPDMAMDAITIDISHFHSINDLYGREIGNQLLVMLAERLNDFSVGKGGFVCHKESDVFSMYLPHQEDYSKLLELLDVTSQLKTIKVPIRLIVGVYPNVDKNVSINSRFDRAKLARDTISHNFMKNIAFYDNELHQKNVLTQSLLNEVDNAIDNHQFIIYYQPKYSILGDKPKLVSAEALVRWNHPHYGMISPGLFIPLFEENGLIPKLDKYVWQEAAKQVKKWKDKFNLSVPVSVNMSRVDMYDPNLITMINSLMEENKLSRHELPLEITESAYTNNHQSIISTVKSLRNLGYKIEMDDFGSGYSSLTMLSDMPVDVLKLDMGFIRNIFANETNLFILKLIVEIKKHLNIPVIAEGVETVEQLNVLKELGCDIVQGYYFSKPVPVNEFEKFILEEVKQGANN